MEVCYGLDFRYVDSHKKPPKLNCVDGAPLIKKIFSCGRTTSSNYKKSHHKFEVNGLSNKKSTKSAQSVYYLSYERYEVRVHFYL